MKKVILTKGLPASGKSTWAKSMVDKGGYKRINKDDLRAMLDNSHYTKKNEQFIEKMRDLLILETLNEGFTPIVDDTNLAPRHYNHIKELVKDIAIIEIKEFNVDVEECIKRDLQRPISVGSDVIIKMYNQFIRKSEKYSQPDLPSAIICDIDGTLTKCIGEPKRSPYDWMKVHLDDINPSVAEVVNNYKELGLKIIIVSGRDSVCRTLTKKWLEDNNIKYDFLYMRPEEDNRKDTIIKREIFDNYIRDKYNIKVVLDDRDCVVDMWRNDLGLNVWQVNDGNF